MPRDNDLIDQFIRGLTEFVTDFAQERIDEAIPRAPRARRVNGKAPKVPKPPKQPKARKERGETLYDCLEVSEKAGPETIAAAYKSLARRFHPDTNKSKQAEERMKKLNHAKDILLDATKRAEYDRELREAR